MSEKGHLTDARLALGLNRGNLYKLRKDHGKLSQNRTFGC